LSRGQRIQMKCSADSLTGQRVANFRLPAIQWAECRQPRFPINRFKFWQSDSL